MQGHLLGLIPSLSNGGRSEFLLSPRSHPTAHRGFAARFGVDGPAWDSRAGHASSVAAAARESSFSGEQSHYDVLGVSSGASPSEIKRAYRLLARKYHPDVSKDVHAGDVFKNIRQAYDVLSNESARAQYDRELNFQKVSTWKRWSYDMDLDERRRMHRWSEVRQRMHDQRERYRTRTYYDNQRDIYEERVNYQREPFDIMLWSTLFILIFVKTIGYRLTLTFSALGAIFDPRLDAGYKMGYITACILGGEGGVLLTLSISFASWLCGKRSSGFVALLVIAMWVGINISRFIPIPQGALIALLYMSIKLQTNFKTSND